MAIPPLPGLSLSQMARTLYGGAATFLAIYVLGSAISFLVHGLLARAIGPGSYGHFAYATHWMAVLLLFCNLGLKSTLTGLVAAYRAQSQWALLRGLLRRATQWTTGASAVVVALALAALWLAPVGPDERTRTLLLVALALPCMALVDIWSATTRGLGAVTRSQADARAGAARGARLCVAQLGGRGLRQPADRAAAGRARPAGRGDRRRPCRCAATRFPGRGAQAGQRRCTGADRRHRLHVAAGGTPLCAARHREPAAAGAAGGAGVVRPGASRGRGAGAGRRAPAGPVRQRLSRGLPGAAGPAGRRAGGGRRRAGIALPDADGTPPPRERDRGRH
ncbi:MAG: oligosaccharide flippase family protein [Rhodoferax sp.]|nr:oligosaccharide flippase family protein [Rhodoferax sp.]